MPKHELSAMFEQFEQETTLMYRPPEMMDEYLHYPIDLRVDIWMVGCVLFALCFGKHPFGDGSKLAICNAQFSMPFGDESDERISEKMRDLVRLCLTPNPNNRPSVL